MGHRRFPVGGSFLPKQRLSFREARTCLSCFQNAMLYGLSVIDIQHSAGGKHDTLPIDFTHSTFSSNSRKIKFSSIC